MYRVGGHRLQRQDLGCESDLVNPNLLPSPCSLFQANAGDSRTVLGVKGRAKPLSFDHKPQNEGENNV